MFRSLIEPPFNTIGEAPDVNVIPSWFINKPVLSSYCTRAKELEALNYYTNEMVKIPLDETLSASENAKKYFDKYGKLKRTYEALTSLIEETQNEILRDFIFFLWL